MRTNRLVIRLSDEEYDLIQRYAAQIRLRPAVMARQQLLLEADRVGDLLDEAGPGAGYEIASSSLSRYLPAD